jgi:hypothetical protein
MLARVAVQLAIGAISLEHCSEAIRALVSTYEPQHKTHGITQGGCLVSVPNTGREPSTSASRTESYTSLHAGPQDISDLFEPSPLTRPATHQIPRTWSTAKQIRTPFAAANRVVVRYSAATQTLAVPSPNVGALRQDTEPDSPPTSARPIAERKTLSAGLSQANADVASFEPLDKPWAINGRLIDDVASR